jgi:hypothetical protein
MSPGSTHPGERKPCKHPGTIGSGQLLIAEVESQKNLLKNLHRDLFSLSFNQETSDHSEQGKVIELTKATLPQNPASM